MRLAGEPFKAHHWTIRVAAIDSTAIWSGRYVAAFPCANRVPVPECDAPIIAAARGGHGAAILLRTIDVVRKLVVRNHVVELRRRLVVPGAPALASIDADRRSLVATRDHPLRIRRIDPERVIVIASGSALDRLPALAGILRTIERHVRKVNNVGVLRINRNFTEVPKPAENTRVGPNSGPASAAIV